MHGASASTTAQYAGIGVFVAIILYALIECSRRSFNSVFLTRRHDANSDDDDAAVAAGTGGAAGHHARPGPVQALGLRPDDVAVLPTFTYRAASSPADDSRGNNNVKGGVATALTADCCSVCLDELRDGALVRMLPSCKHYFHAECVDVWLLSHATCPVCRGSPGPEKVRLGLASLSPPLPQLRRLGATAESPEGGGTSEAKDAIVAVSSRSPSHPVRSPMHFQHMVANSAAMSPSPTRSRAPDTDSRMGRTRAHSPATLESHDVGV